MISFSVLGIKTSLSVPFAAFITIMLYIDKTGIMLPSMCAVALHESGHLAAMLCYGCHPQRIEVKIGSLIMYGRFAESIFKENIITLCGPAVNLLSAAAFYFLYSITMNEILFVYCVVSAAIGIFNLLPVKGLDGCTLIYNCILVKKGAMIAEKICKAISVIFCIAIFLAGAWIFIIQNGGISAMLISLYLLLGFLIKQH